MVALRDRKGDTLTYPKPVLKLPFADEASTGAAHDDYQVVCGPGGKGEAGGAPVCLRGSGRAGSRRRRW